MDFSFVRRSSRDASGEEGDRAAALKNSITEGSSRIFGSVMAKKTGLLDGLSSKFDQVFNSDEQDVPKPSPSGAESSMPFDYTSPYSTITAPQKPIHPKSRVPPPKPPAPSRASRSNGQTPRQYSADTSSIGSGRSSPRVDGNLGKHGRQVTMPAYTTHPNDEYKVNLGRSGIMAGIPSLAKTFPEAPSGKESYAVNGILNEIRPEAIDSSPKKSYNTTNTTEVSVVTDTFASYSSPYTSASAECSPHYTSSSCDRSLPASGSEFPSRNVSNTEPKRSSTAEHTPYLTTHARDKDLLVITPTSGAALPMPSIKPTQSDPIGSGYESDGGDSSATEGCDEVLSDPEDLDYDGDLGGEVIDGRDDLQK